MNRPHCFPRSRRSTARRILAALGALALGFSFGAAGLPAQGAPFSNLPVIEPRLTRIIGSDTLQIQEPALSPDGRWVLFSTQTPAGGGYIHIVSSQGDVVRRLIDDPNALEPVWFPEGNRIAYYSRENLAIMTVPFDGRRGQLAGRPQRVTLDRALPWFRLSPDGRWIAYRIWSEGGMTIRVVPSSGGTARALGARGDMIILMDWSADGRFVYYGVPSRGSQQGLFRVAVDGAAPEEVRELPTGESAPRAPYFVAPLPGGAAAGSSHIISGLHGRPVARIALPQNASAAMPGRTFTPDGTRLLAVVSNTAHPVRVLPVAGGAPRQLGEARADEFPLGWSPDGNEILFATQLDGRNAIMSAPVSGGAASEIGPMPDRGPPQRDQWRNPITFSPDGRYLMYSRPTPESQDRTLVIRPVAGGDERVVTRSLAVHGAFRLVGPGGTPNIAGGDFLYLERQGDRVELRATPVDGSSRLLRSLAATDVGRGKPIGVFEDRVAYVQYERPEGVPLNPSASPRILVARGPGGTPKVVAAVPGVIAFDDVVWSPDGRWIAATAYVGSADSNYIKVAVVGVTPEGNVSSPARLIDTPTTGSAWGLRWLPDGSAITLYGQSLPDMGFDVWLVPIRNSGRPVALTRDERGDVAFNVLSPDGRYLAYRTSVERGSSLWLAELGDALTRAR